MLAVMTNKCPRCTHPMDADTAGRSRFDRSIRICPVCCTTEAQWEIVGLDYPPEKWPISSDDAILTWASVDELKAIADVLRILDAVCDEAAAEAVGDTADQRADSALGILRTKLYNAGIDLPEDDIAGHRQKYLEYFLDHAQQRR